MASRGLLGFVGGFAKTALEDRERRQKEEEEKRKLLLLEQLRRDTSDYEYQRSLGEVDDQKTEVDYTTGKKKQYNKRGELIGTSDVPASDMDLYKRKLDASDLDMENTRSQIASRSKDDARADAQLGISRAQLGLSQARFNEEKKRGFGSLDGSSSSQALGPIAARAHELLYQNKDVVEEAQKQGVPAEVISMTAQAVIKRQAAHARAGEEVKDFQEQFLRAIAALKNQYKKDDKERGTRRSLDSN